MAFFFEKLRWRWGVSRALKSPLHRGVPQALRRALPALLGLSLLAALLDFAVLGGIRAFLGILGLGAQADPTQLPLWMGGMVVLALARLAVGFARQSRMEGVWVRAEALWMAGLARRLHSLHPACRHGESVGRLAEGGAQAVRTLVSAGEAAQQGVQALFQLAVFLPVLFVLSPGLTLGVLCLVLPVLAWLQRRLMGLGKPLDVRLRDRSEGVSLLREWGELLGHWTVRKDLVQARQALANWRGRSAANGQNLARQRALLVQASEALSALGTVLVFGLSGWLMGRNLLEPQELVLYCAALFLCYKPVKECARLAPLLREAWVAHESLDALGQLPSRPRAVRGEVEVVDADRVGSKVRSEVRSEVRFEVRLEVRGLSFAYAGAPSPVFADWSAQWDLQVPLLLRGPNGAGKTTLLRLLAGLEIPQEGAVVWSGVAHPGSGLAEAGFMAQPPRLPPGRGELRDRARGASVAQARMLQVLQIDSVWRRIEGEAILEAGDGARGLSAGQQQRLALAWLVLSSCAVLLLDEPVSALPLAERPTVMLALAQWAREEKRVLVASSHEAPPKGWRVLELGSAAGAAL